MIPVNVITGFLGSGKTTLLREVLQHPVFKNAAVIVNEFGEVGLDHMLLEQVEEGVLLLDNGCVCCTIRSDLQDTIHDLQYRASQQLIPDFDRVFVETTGLADPAPILSTLLAEPMIRNHFRAGNVICTVDGLAGLDTLRHHQEALKQVAVAERILLTKADMASDAQLQDTREAIARINPYAQVTPTFGHGFDPDDLFRHDIADQENRPDEVDRWLEKARAAEAQAKRHHHHDDHHHHHHSDAFNSFVVRMEPSIDWGMFATWLTALLHKHGDKILRVKGVLHVQESDSPVVMQCVQHVVYPPMHLPEWPTDIRESQLVFITNGIKEAAIRRSMAVFLGLGEAAGQQQTPAIIEQKPVIHA